MSDVELRLTDQGADLVLEDEDLALDPSLTSDVVLSLWCDARAREEDELPDNTRDRRGWWGQDGLDDIWGSRWWLARRSTITRETINLLREAGTEALAWMLTEEIASSVEVEATRFGQDRILVEVKISRGTNPLHSTMWDATALLVNDPVSVKLAVV